MWRTIGRLIWIPFAALFAVLAAAFVIVTLGVERFVRERSDTTGNDIFDQALGWFSQGEFVFTTFQGLSILPPLVLIIVGEVAKLRSSLYYVVGGGLVAIAGPILSQVMATGGEFTMPANTFLSVLATAGFTGGFVYWVLAGRKA